SVPVLFGRKHTAVQYWFGPKYMFSSYDFKSNLGGLIDEAGNMHFLGGTAGIALGYKSFWFVSEVTALNLFSREEVLGEEQNLGGLLVYPAFGFMTRF